ncbi:MAG: GAF domain-containing sensor histidine kinase, partial [Bacteroidales bacterium]|nr:GAF domain-containing sensor histidine kinase [Bacteroidales bacterium]
MKKPETPANEQERLEALKEYSILDTLPEEEYDEITFIASQICETPISLITLIDNNRQWFKSYHGIEVNETPREVSFCAHAIHDQNNPMIIPDSRIDERFHDNPLVKGEPHVIFYAGIPLVSSNGHSLGTLCVIDKKPKQLDDAQIKALNALSKQVMKLFELRKKSKDMEMLIYELEVQNKGLNEFAGRAAHDLKSPLNGIIQMTDLLKYQLDSNKETDSEEIIGYISSASYQLTNLIDGILKYSKNSKLLSENKEDIEIYKIINNTINLLDKGNEVNFEITGNKDAILFTNRVALEQIFINLITNSIKFNDKDKTYINIHLEDDQ